MKNPYLVLCEKEQDIARVRKEIAALLTVIPLLWDTGSSSDSPSESLAARAENGMTDNGMTDAVMYHPFVETLLRMK